MFIFNALLYSALVGRINKDFVTLLWKKKNRRNIAVIRIHDEVSVFLGKRNVVSL